MLTIENTHVPISVSIGDTLERERTHICERDPAGLVHNFIEELERRGKNIRAQVRAAFMPEDVKMLTKAQRLKIEEWCDQMPVLGLNFGRYDLNLIREHFTEHLSDTTGKVRVAKNGNQIMFILTNSFRFLDIINYLGPGTSYKKWVKAYECETVKSWFPYEWFDTPEKLSGFSRTSEIRGLVFETEGRLYSHEGGMGGVPATVQRKGYSGTFIKNSILSSVKICCRVCLNFASLADWLDIRYLDS